MRGVFAIGIALAVGAGMVAALSPGSRAAGPPSDADVAAAFGKQGIRINGQEAASSWNGS
jgi:hypothetical protein